MKKGFWGVIPALLMVGCAAGPGDFAADDPIECRSCAVGTSNGTALSGGERSLLRQSRKLYQTAVGDAGWDGETEYSGRVKVYRWGANANAPMTQYAWDAESGERWHCVRETCGGKPESCGRNGVEPIDAFYAVDDVNVTFVDDSRPVATPSDGLALSLR